jgi:hypothetical protein
MEEEDSAVDKDGSGIEICVKGVELPIGDEDMEWNDTSAFD